MSRFISRAGPLLALAVLTGLLAGCGTTKWSDSPRTATEQLLVSDAIDRAISQIDFSSLADQKVYLDTRFIITALDQNYVISTLRQHMLASGCIVMDKAEEATYVVEVRTGSVGTNRQDLLFGVPSTTLPTVGLLPTGAATIPEIALVKRTNQQGVCKIAVFAYDRMSGRPVWQSGNRKVASRAKDVWVMGAGPFQKGTIYDGTAFAGERLTVPLVKRDASKDQLPAEGLSVAQEQVFEHDEPQVVQQNNPSQVNNVGYLATIPGSSQAPGNAAQPSAAPATPATATASATANSTSTASPPAPSPPPRAAYTPPPPPPVAPLPPPPPGTGPQGNLTPQSVLQPTVNPAATTAGAIQTYNWAKDVIDKRGQPQP
jgi:hypothetical protein